MKPPKALELAFKVSLSLIADKSNATFLAVLSPKGEGRLLQTKAQTHYAGFQPAMPTTMDETKTQS